MLLSAHQDTIGVDEMKTFNSGYLTFVTCVLLSWNSLLLVIFVSDGSTPDWCWSGSELTLILIPVAFSLLAVIIVVLIIIKSNRVLKNLKHQHFKNLPSKNALTFRDTLILFFSVTSQYFLINIQSFLFSFKFLSKEKSLILKVVTHFSINDMMICFVFPIYIIFKTKKYLRKLWDDSAPIIHENNDFFAENPAEVSTETS